MKKERAARKVKFHVYISSIVLITVSILTAVLLRDLTVRSTAVAHEVSNRLFHEISTKVIGQVNHLLDTTSALLELSSLMPEMLDAPEKDGLTHRGLDTMLFLLKKHPYFLQVYAGYSTGGFLAVTATRGDPRIIKQHGAPGKTRFVVRSLSAGPDKVFHRHLSFLDEDLHIISGRVEKRAGFDPRKRPWYRQALKTEENIFTEPYRYHYTDEPGITCARRIPGKGGVMGFDITLERFSGFLGEQHVSRNSLLFMMSRGGLLIASSENASSGDKRREVFQSARDSSDPVVRAVARALPLGGGKEPEQNRFLTVENEKFLVSVSNFGSDFGKGQTLAVAAPVTDFTGHISKMRYKLIGFSILLLFLAIPLVLFFSMKMTLSLTLLEKQTERIRRLDFSERKPLRSRVKEIDSLIRAFSLMRKTLRRKTELLLHEQRKMSKLIELGIALSAEQDKKALLNKILFEAKELSRSDAVTLYLRTKDDHLRFALRTMEDELPSLEIPLFHPETGAPNHHHVSSHVALTGETVNIPDVYAETRFDLSGTRKFDAESGYVTRSMVSIPLKPRGGEVVGVLQLMNAIDPETGEITPYPEEEVSYIEALASQAAVAVDNKNLLEEQRELFDAFTRTIAGAIDAKSPHTGGHCSRVPEIAAMLAEAANNTADGPFKEFTLGGEKEWQEFRLAAWMHDCGKVTIPEFIVNKATKLETIHNRIHELRTRFELLWRDAEIACLEKRLTGQYDEKALEAELAAERERIREEYAFVAECNIGGEFMDDGKIERLNRIASRKWIRNLDDSLGLSLQEKALRKDIPVAPLPAEECLLMDKKEHIVPRSDTPTFNMAAHGINMEVPEHMYNRGELHNLAIRRGTLTFEERFKINEHIIQTIIMLGRLPFPKHLSRVPEYACSHHETLVGTGYPRKLTKAEMSVPARIMAIADIFEALTASDRPYKPSKTIGETLRIMSFMRDDRHIDPDLFDLFLTRGIHEAYARKYLPDHRIDNLDIRPFLSGSKEP